jgi:Icc-related predicted phosphoesterase
MKIWHISDTHGFHGDLVIPQVDLVIHSGDCSNYRNPVLNKNEVLDFLEWYGELPFPKIYVAGNHDTSIEARLVKPSVIKAKGIVYLENSHTRFQELNIWGSPIIPTFNDWAWNRDRDKIHKTWSMIPVDTDILVTHGPPRGVLDLTINRDNEVQIVGCSNLYKTIQNIKPKLVLFGHIHNSRDIFTNTGVYTQNGIIYSNGSCVTDGNWQLTSNGNILEI